jgi:hypothetical protein
MGVLSGLMAVGAVLEMTLLELLESWFVSLEEFLADRGITGQLSRLPTMAPKGVSRCFSAAGLGGGRTGSMGDR